MPVESRQETIRRSGPADAEALSELFLEVFGERRAPSLWSWKYWNNPNGAAGYVLDSSGRIVTHVGGILLELRVGSGIARAVQLVDFMSSRRYPGGAGAGSSFARTTIALFRDVGTDPTVRIAYGFPGERHRLAGERILGYRPGEQVVEMTLESHGTGETTEVLAPRHLPVLCRVPMDLGLSRTHRYLNWRYLDHPLHHYRVVQIRRAFWRQPEMTAIVRETDDAWLLMELGGSFAAHSLRELVFRLGRLGKPVRAWGSPAHPVGRMLIESGFRPEPRDHWLEWAWFEEARDPRSRRFFRDDPSERGQFYYTLGDYDVF